MAFSFSAVHAQQNDRRTALYRAANEFQLHHLRYYEYGVYGKRGGTGIFIAHEDDVANDDRLYWTMVKVLSEKYGCFMKARQKTEASYTFRCRDGRAVHFKHGQSGSTQFFTVKQFDNRGRQIILAAVP